MYFWVEKLKEMLFEMKPEKLEPVPSKIALDDLQVTPEDEETAGSELECEQLVEDGRVSGKSPNSSSSPPPQIATGETLTDRKSTFQAHVARVTSVEDVKYVRHLFKYTEQPVNFPRFHCQWLWELFSE